MNSISVLNTPNQPSKEGFLSNFCFSDEFSSLFLKLISCLNPQQKFFPKNPHCLSKFMPSKQKIQISNSGISNHRTISKCCHCHWFPSLLTSIFVGLLFYSPPSNLTVNFWRMIMLPIFEQNLCLTTTLLTPSSCSNNQNWELSNNNQEQQLLRC